VEEAVETNCIAVAEQRSWENFTQNRESKGEKRVDARGYARHVTEIARHNDTQ
jgi:hypothetical protein